MFLEQMRYQQGTAPIKSSWMPPPAWFRRRNSHCRYLPTGVSLDRSQSPAS
jgi:hypothetical protein